jgi:SAM-dependent methyltransferase
MISPDPLHQSIDRYLHQLGTGHGDHMDRSAALLRLAANYRAQVLRGLLWQRFEGVVEGGLFAGLRLPQQASEGCLIPKLLGIYEAPLIPHLRRLLARPPEVVLNIGCAEGYYAVGLARLLPDTHVHAFDIDANARELCGATAALNGVSERITIGGRFEGGGFRDFAGRRVLVICDIEGAEFDLLDPVRFSGLAGFDVIVEMHDNPATGPAARMSSILPERLALVGFRGDGERTGSEPPARGRSSPFWSLLGS